jgi:hypothetical protein
MIGTLIGIIFVVIILGVCWWAIQTLLPLIPMAEPFRTILRVRCETDDRPAMVRPERFELPAR